MALYSPAFKYKTCTREMERWKGGGLCGGRGKKKKRTNDKRRALTKKEEKKKKNARDIPIVKVWK